MGIVAWLIVGAFAGYVAGMVVPGDERFGVIGHVVLGIAGALVGGFIAGLVTGGDYLASLDLATIVVAVIGAIVLVVAVNLVTGSAGRTA
jgi:uncharacterized membrane protein YeaQ/YmgE (transglycosylase-associated protein family)